MSAHPQKKFLIINPDGFCVGLTAEFDSAKDGGFRTPPLIPCLCGCCGKLMPELWETVCKGCRKTNCYEHSQAFKGSWYCDDCVKKESH